MEVVLHEGGSAGLLVSLLHGHEGLTRRGLAGKGRLVSFVVVLTRLLRRPRPPLASGPPASHQRRQTGAAEEESGGRRLSLGPTRFADDEDEPEDVHDQHGAHVPQHVPLGLQVQAGHLLRDEDLVWDGARVSLALAPQLAPFHRRHLWRKGKGGEDSRASGYFFCCFFSPFLYLISPRLSFTFSVTVFSHPFSMFLFFILSNFLCCCLSVPSPHSLSLTPSLCRSLPINNPIPCLKLLKQNKNISHSFSPLSFSISPIPPFHSQPPNTTPIHYFSRRARNRYGEKFKYSKSFNRSSAGKNGGKRESEQCI